MKKGLRAKLFAFALALCLCTTMVTPAFAASGRYNSFGNRWSFSNWWNNRWNHDDDNTSDSNKSDSSETKLKLVEDQSTVAEGTELRASTYEVENTDAASNTSTIKYFPVTMYNYNTATINKATHNAEAAEAYKHQQQSIDTWKGLYFNNGNPVNDRSHKYNRPEYLGDNAGTANGKEYRTQAYAKWNYWGGNVHYTGNYIYSGLVEKNLDKSNNIVFTNTDPGLFRSDDTTNSYGKEIYTNVGLPFQYDKSKNEYTFNSNEMSAHFTDKAKSNTNLTYDATPQTITDLDAQGKNSNASWLPFDKETSIATDNATYHFGMQAVIPFSMTSNGRLDPADDESDAITFDFSGDDDVWVFVDGKLVLDIGGIHNEMAGTMNFATNEWKVLKSADNTCNDTVGDMNGQKMSGKLFNTDRDSEKGVLETDRETFAATTSHTLTVFYLERGAGASNCKIKFNLPMEDSVSVKKLVSDIDSNGDKISSDSQTNLNNHEFAFKLFKNDKPLANTNYIILDESNQPIDTATTAKDGTFKLKNKQTAKFVGQIPKDGNTYYVQEVEENGWQTPSSSYTALAANGSKEKQAADGATSAKVLIKGSDEANDQLNYTFTNVLTHVDTTTVQPQDDKIVIDYGLPVKIDVLDNDAPLTGSGNTIQKMEITGIRQAGSEDAFSAPTNNDNALQLTYGKAYIYAGEGTGESRDSRIIYTPTEQATDLDKIEYQVKVTAKTSGGNTETDTGEATVTVIPATSMYYEENFSDMVTFSKTGWTDVNDDTSGTVYQEPGVVKTPNDSPYGSDNAYMNSSGDSCGTSKYVSTADGKAKAFKYTFTGTGTSFFARSSSDSGYMRVQVTNSAGKVVKTLYRDTKYQNTGTLYNVPVFTWNAETYGTYTVTVTIAKNNNGSTYGTDFWLDGIRVMNPMNPESSNLTIAQDAYAADGESNMTFATLRNALLADTTQNKSGELVWDNKNFVVFTDTDGDVKDASTYQSNGPKEEVYLAEGQSVSFSLTDWNANENHLYLGIKAPMEAGTVQFGDDDSVAVNNTVDCYYDVAKHATISEVDSKKVATLTITNNSNSIISLTNIKVTGTPNFVIIPKKNIDSVNPEGAEE